MLYIGVMSGTSCDGVDVALVDINDKHINCQNTFFLPYHKTLRQQLLTVIAGGAFTATAFSQLDAELGQIYAQAVNEMLKKSQLKANAIKAIGLHGQTIDHQPPNNTWQLGSAAHVAALTGIDVVADFRSMDVALGGQGAPLAPALHQALFYQGDDLAVLNLGGIANLSLLSASGFLGFDTGPANCLMDLWVQKHCGQSHDAAGEWAGQGQVHADLLSSFLSEPYFAKAAPKSTGRELFNQVWLDSHLSGFGDIDSVDVQATLLQLTISTVSDAIKQHMPKVKKMVVCGGGVHNTALMSGLVSEASLNVINSLSMGVDPDHVESILMAWLAACHDQNISLDLTAVTGTSQKQLYGVRYQA